MSQLVNSSFHQGSPKATSAKVPFRPSEINYSSGFSLPGQVISRCYSLQYELIGSADLKENKRSHRLETGSFLVMAQGNDISVNIEARQLVAGLRFFLTEEAIKDVWSALYKTQEQLLENRNWKIMLPCFIENKYRSTNKELGFLISTFGQNLKNKILSDEKINDAFFFSLVLALSRHQENYLTQLAALPAHKKTTREELYRRILVTRDYMHDNFTKTLSLTDLADTAHISEFHFVRTFKVIYGESPYKYLLRLRLNLARKLLLQKEQNINELALECGFNEVQAFLKLFRKEFGVGPTLFRKLNQE